MVVVSEIVRNFVPQMGKEGYRIDLFSRGLDGKTLEYDLTDEFFQQIDGLIQRGQLHTNVRIEGNVDTAFHFTIHSEGVVYAPCDRCLADVELRIDTTDTLAVRLGDDYSDEGDIVIIPEKDGTIDLAQYIYEFIALCMPLKLVHEPGKCDEAMIARLSEHLSARSGEDDESDDE